MLSALHSASRDLDFGDTQACLRIRRFQTLCVQHQLHGILLVPGLDGKYNDGSHQALGYLFLGKSHRDAVDATKLSSELEDCIVLVTAHSLAIYAPTRALAERLVEPLTGRITNVLLFTPTAEEAADQDTAEELKIASFVQMMVGTKRIGIACGEGSDPQQAAPVSLVGNSAALMALERWPLLQAYGLDGVGRSGFFTMSFEVFDVYSLLQSAVYAQLDARAVESTCGQAVPVMEQHWDEMFKVLSSRAPTQRDTLTEKQVAEPLAGYFAYGMVRAAPGVSQAVTMVPRVIFGTRTGDDAAQSDNVTIAQQGALHMCVEGADPRSPLRAARTYLLTRGSLERDPFADPDQDEQDGFSYEAMQSQWDSSGSRESAQVLLRTYSALVDAAHAAMEHFASQDRATPLSAKEVALDTFTRRAEQLGVSQHVPAPNSSVLRFALWQCDHANNVQGMAVRGSRQLKVTKLSLSGVVGPGKVPLGGLVYADSFLDLPSGKLLNFTAAIPATAALPASGPEAAVAARAARSFARMLTRAAANAGEPYEASAEHKASIRERERVAAGAAATAEMQAARLRATHADGAGATSEDEDADEVDKQQVDNDIQQDEKADQSTTARKAAASKVKAAGMHTLGRLLTIGGGDDAVLLTGSTLCPAEHGQLFCFSGGLAFMCSHVSGHALWLCELRRDLEAITLQRLPGGEDALVLRGKEPACGLPPACHATASKFLALPLNSLSVAARKHLVAVVLPAWQASCRESTNADLAATHGSVYGPVTYLKDMSAPAPFAASAWLQQQHAYALQMCQQQQAAAPKAWPALVAPDDEVEHATSALDKAELSGPLNASAPILEQLLEASAAATPSSTHAGPGVLDVTLLVGPPGADQAMVAGVVQDGLVGSGVRVQMALLPASVTLDVSKMSVAITSARAAGAQHLILATCCYDDVVSQLTLLANAAAAMAGGEGAVLPLRLCGVTACLTSDLLMQDPARHALMPGVAACLAPGYVDAVVAGGAEWNKVQSLAEVCLPGVPVLRATKQALLRGREELLPALSAAAAGTEATAARQARVAAGAGARRWLVGGAVTALTLPRLSLLSGALQAAQISFSGALDVNSLRRELLALGLSGSATTPPPPLFIPLSDAPTASAGSTALPPALVCVTGWCVAAPGQGVMEVVASRAAGMRTREWPLPQGAGCGASEAQLGVACGQLTFMGANLAMSLPALRALLERCGPGSSSGGGSSSSSGSGNALAAPVMRTVASLSKAERDAVQAARAFDTLPQGYYFNGTQYYDEFGDGGSMTHPEIARFLEKHVQALNEQAQAAHEAAMASAAAAGNVRVSTAALLQ